MYKISLFKQILRTFPGWILKICMGFVHKNVFWYVQKIIIKNTTLTNAKGDTNGPKFLGDCHLTLPGGNDTTSRRGSKTLACAFFYAAFLLASWDLILHIFMTRVKRGLWTFSSSGSAFERDIIAAKWSLPFLRGGQCHEPGENGLQSKKKRRIKKGEPTKWLRSLIANGAYFPVPFSWPVGFLCWRECCALRRTKRFSLQEKRLFVFGGALFHFGWGKRILSEILEMSEISSIVALRIKIEKHEYEWNCTKTLNKIRMENVEISKNMIKKIKLKNFYFLNKDLYISTISDQNPL